MDSNAFSENEDLIVANENNNEESKVKDNDTLLIEFSDDFNISQVACDSNEEKGEEMATMISTEIANIETCVPTIELKDHSCAQFSKETTAEDSKFFEECNSKHKSDVFIDPFKSDLMGVTAQEDSGHFEANTMKQRFTLNLNSEFGDVTDNDDTVFPLEDDEFESNATDKMELNKCYLCSSKLVNAQVLSCLHRFCYKCIVDKVFSEPLNDGLKSSYNEHVECPECSELTPVSYLVKDVLSVENNFFDRKNGDDSGEENNYTICTACKSGEVSVGKCYTCDSHLCESCVSAHQTMRCFEAHQLHLFSKTHHSNGSNCNPTCAKHNDEVVQYYCTSCQALCCYTCIQTLHQNNSVNGSPSHHSCHKINEKLIRKMKDHLHTQVGGTRDLFSSLKEMVNEYNSNLNELSFNKESVKQAIDEQYHSLKAMIDKYHEDLLKELNTLHQKRRLELWDETQQCETLSYKFEEALTYAQLFVDKHLEHNLEYYVDCIKLKELISRRLFSLSKKNIPVERKRKNFSAVGLQTTNKDFITFSPVELNSIFSPTIFGALSTADEAEYSPTNLSNGILPNVARFERRLNLSDLSPDLLSPTLSSGVDASLMEPLTQCLNPSNFVNQSMVSSVPSVPPMAITKSKIAKQASLVVNTPDSMLPSNHTFSGQSVATHSLSARTTPEPSLIQSHSHPLASQFASGLNLRSLSNSSSQFSAPINTGTASTASQQIDLSDIYTRINLAQLAMCDNVGNQQSLGAVPRAASSSPSPQPTPGVPLDTPGFILNDTAISNLNELAKLTTQQNGLSIAGPLTTPTPPSSSANTPPLSLAPRSSSKVNIMQIRCKFGQLGPQRGQFSSPHGFCLGVEEEIVIADTNNHRICIFDKNGEFKHMFGTAGKDEGQLWYPRKVSLNLDDAVAIIRTNTNGAGASGCPRYVICDRGSERSRMQIFTRNGHFIRKIAIRYIDIVAGLAITPAGHIVAVDSVSPTVFAIAESGDLLRWFDCSEHMREPSDIAVNGQEYYICDFKGACVVVFDEEGRYLRRIGGEQITKYPNGIDISDAGDILVGDSHGNRFHVVVFDKNGAMLSEFECPYVKVSRCCGLKITSEGYVVTLAKNNHHVLILNTLYIM
ncbi:Brain tumor protein-like protein [Leptotrombidium deliense]|uniref:Brain tumor protein-like protein n=1 Tax=Leptotrombidium deliense TaxID=299467 RepID=A0A443SHJ0_9ACAR|nr:Brain tumor protein-like protein [Leptotrombidium deliense]